MRAVRRALLEGPPEAVLAVLHDPARWETLGLPALQPAGDGWEGTWSLTVPRRLTLTVRVDRALHGARWVVRGPGVEARAEVTAVGAVAPGEAPRTSVLAEVDLTLGWVASGAWTPELAEQLGLWLKKLERAARAGSDRSDG